MIDIGQMISNLKAEVPRKGKRDARAAVVLFFYDSDGRLLGPDGAE